jgi:hypothetical protein
MTTADTLINDDLHIFVTTVFRNVTMVETLQDGTHTLSRNVGKQLPHDAT